MTISNTLTRRSLMASAPALALAVATPAAAATMPIEETPIMVLFEEWDAIFRLGYESSDFSENEVNDHCDRMRALEQRMEAIPSTSAIDLAAKIIALTGYGDYEFNPDARPNMKTWAELERLIGRERPELRGVS